MEITSDRWAFKEIKLSQKYTNIIDSKMKKKNVKVFDRKY